MQSLAGGQRSAVSGQQSAVSSKNESVARFCRIGITPLQLEALFAQCATRKLPSSSLQGTAIAFASILN
ncbi:MAG: hypothetical protein KME42_23190 [Tildeniella nuda ZEHNDER 1965/U140]|nr:hypothetical protein [Tildeniella nuda ZEHNDER 1965/U140]